MLRRTIALTVLLLVPSAARAQYAGCSPCDASAVGTTQKLARLNENLQLELWSSQIFPVYETAVKTVEEVHNGQTVQKEVVYTVCKQVQSKSMMVFEPGDVKAYGTDRKRVSEDDLASLLSDDVRVLVCPHDQKIDGTYLRLVKPGTVVLVLPPPQPAILAAPAPFAPAPPRPAEGEVAPAPPPTAEAAPAPPAPTAPPAEAEAAPAPLPPVEGEVAPVPPDAGPPTDSGPTLPAGAEPHASLAVLDGGTLKLRQTLASGGEKTAMRRTIDDNGNEVCVPVSVKQATRTETTQELDIESVQAFTAAGEQIPAGELETRLANETPVLVSGDGRAIDPGYLHIIREDAIVLIVPVVEAPMAMPAPVAPLGPDQVEGEAAPPPPAT